MEANLKQWTSLASHFIGEHFDHCKPFLDKDYQGLHPLVRFVSTQLYISCHFSSESALLLLRKGQEWDADILNRSIVEGVVKYIFMLYGSDEEKLTKAKEYWDILPNYSAIKRSDKAHSFLIASNGHNSPEWRAIQDLTLTESEVETLRDGSNRRDRNLLYQKWSFSNIVNWFAKSEDKGLSLLVHLAYNYGMSSHLIHKDADGVGMVWERCTRDPEKQNAVKNGHIARAISDVCTFAEMRSLFLFKSCKKEQNFITPLRESYSILFSELSKATENFNKIEYRT